MAVVAGGTVAQKPVQPDSPSAVVLAPVVADVPVLAEAATPVTMAAYGTDDALVPQQDSPPTALSTTAASPSQPGVCTEGAAARLKEVAVTSHGDSLAERTQDTMLEQHDGHPTKGDCTAGEAAQVVAQGDQSAAAAAPPAFVHDEGPARDSSPVLGLVDSLSSHLSAGHAAKPSFVEPAYAAESCSTVQ